jgi:hypothetical protein
MHMPNRIGNAVTAILIGALASVALVAAMNGAAQAADNCLSGPKGAAPQGSHWYYRIDHATKRNCWYVRAAGEKPVAPRNSSLTQASPQAEPPLQPSIANARAEAGRADIGPSNAAAAMPAASVEASADNPRSAVASRWLDGSSADSKNPSAPRRSDSGASLNSPTPPVAEVPLAAAELPSGSGLRSIQTLPLAIVGAIALAGLMAGVIFRFGSAARNDRQDVRGSRRVPWDSIELERATPSPPSAASAPTPWPDAARETREAIIPNEIVQLLSKLSKQASA